MKPDTRKIFRMLDANLNRLSEGLRVVEDILRFGRDSAALSGEARKMRHAFGKTLEKIAPRSRLLAGRRSHADVGAKRGKAGRRAGLADILAANLRRAQESARVLEEGARFLGSGPVTRALQRLRYRVYELEAAVARYGL